MRFLQSTSRFALLVPFVLTMAAPAFAQDAFSTNLPPSSPSGMSSPYEESRQAQTRPVPSPAVSAGQDGGNTAADMQLEGTSSGNPVGTSVSTPLSNGQNTDLGSAPSNTGDGLVPPSEPANVPPAIVPGHEPALSLLDDPVGAISSMLKSVERNPGLPHDLSPWGMFMAADWVVKGVMLGLAFASLVTWTVWLAKTIEIACARARANRALAAVSASTIIRDAAKAVENRGGPAAFMVRMAQDELRRSDAVIDQAGPNGVKERTAMALGRIEAQAGRRLTKGTGVLATIGSTAPFVGLFGTVWGIMNSFIGISEAQTTNLAVVAPGIAEALLATAIGLVAAIPAVIIYNVFARSITGYRQLLSDNAAAVERLVSWDLDFRKADAARMACAEGSGAGSAPARPSTARSIAAGERE